MMKSSEYIEGPQATRNFEEGMKSLFKVPKGEVVKAEKKKLRASRADLPPIFVHVRIRELSTVPSWV